MTTQKDIPQELSERAAALATKSGRSANEIINRALSSGLDAWEREFDLIQKAAEQCERGEYASEEDIRRIRNKYRPD